MQKDASHVDIVGDEIILKTFSGGNKLNIKNLVKSFDIYESLDNYTIAADFYIAEGIELMNEFPLGGEETIELTIQTPTRRALTYKFFVESIQGLTTNDMSNLRQYKLRCVTKDYLKNSYMVMTRRYRDMLYHDALNEVITQDLGAEIPLITKESTKGKFDYACNMVRPFQVINLIKERAVSAEGNKSSVFVFYQDYEGYHFQTIEKLITDRKPGAQEKEFFYDTSNRNSPYEKVINYRNILSYETTGQGSSIKKVVNGAMRNQFREFDIHRGSYWLMNEYNNLGDHTIFKKTDDSFDFNSAEYNGFTMAMPGVTRMAVKDGTRPEMEHNKNLHYQRPFHERITQYTVRIRTYGDTNMRVGDVIKVNFPEISGLTREPQQNKIFSENYIVTNLKHRCDQTRNNVFEHFLVMDIAKPNQYGRSLG